MLQSKVDSRSQALVALKPRGYLANLCVTFVVDIIIDVELRTVMFIRLINYFNRLKVSEKMI